MFGVTGIAEDYPDGDPTFSAKSLFDCNKIKGHYAVDIQWPTIIIYININLNESGKKIKHEAIEDSGKIKSYYLSLKYDQTYAFEHELVHVKQTESFLKNHF